MSDTPKPSVGRIVLYRTMDDSEDQAAIVTALVDTGQPVPLLVTSGGDRVHLHVFVPPTGRKDFLHPTFGVPYSSVPSPGCWRWPERV